ncbi:leucine-rich repeat-containing protein 3B [Nothobranchius furzeri]|uniref:Leucine rich repeat containing 3B n=2 Tax=Nothobranchius TaxID=28779 RepID=A0A1A8AVR1_NOTFU|nr:leucine-rich repeat-containing protein 3B [Nothobranchius furzeri]XP_054601642.1 leucine-rich repeat-containing protein 3B [Nothobranchius furzeri]KAF7221602.1 leucine rich repeat containing 3B [Nothobranchius furzeri]
MTLLDLWLSRSIPMCLLLQSLVLMALCFPSASMCPKGCSCLRDPHLHGLNVTCSQSRLKEIPLNLPGNTVLLRLDHNQIGSVPEQAFNGLSLLRELNLSHNAVESLGENAFSGIEGTLQVLDLSHNHITSVHKDAFARLRARIIVDDNPWHCDCALQQAIGGMAHNHEAAARVLCRSSELLNQEGRSFMKVDIDLCNLAKRTTDYAMLVTMFGWFAMVISYVVYYVRQNQEDARRHLEYLKSLPSKPKKPDETDDISTVV